MLRPWVLTKRIEELILKLKPPPAEGVRLDFYSFSQPEQLVILRNYEIIERYRNGHAKFSAEEAALMTKFDEIVLKRTFELFLYNMSNILMLSKVERWFFRLNFSDFLARWSECRENLRKWPKEEKEEFLRHIRANDEKDGEDFND